MSRIFSIFCLCAVLSAAGLGSSSGALAAQNAATEADRPALEADHAFLEAVAKSDHAALDALLDDFGNVFILVSQHQPEHGKPVHITRLWIKRDGQW